MTAFKLDDIRTAANENYKAFEVELPTGELVQMRNVLQLSESERKDLVSEKDEDYSTIDRLRDHIRIVVEDKPLAERLVEAMGDNLAHLVQLVRTYNEQTQAGEA